MTTNYTLNGLAYIKVFFHISKYLHQRVNGVLVGKETGDGNVEIVDAIPLLHHWTSLSPMMEIGLDLANQYAESTGLRIVGYYQASEKPDDTSLFPVGEKIASRLKQKFDKTIAFVLDSSPIGTGHAALIPYLSATTVNPVWKPVQSSSNTPSPFAADSPFQLSPSDLPERALSLVREKRLHLQFGDFDDHLEDVAIDWLRNKACIPPDW